MATELITKVWCDIHLTEKDEHVEGRPRTWEGWQLDLCEECAQPIELAFGLFQQYGHKGKARAPRAKLSVQPGEPYICPQCGWVGANRQSLLSHGRRTHQMNAAELLGLPSPYICPDCGKGFSTPQGMARHQVNHGAESASA
jgi:predicted RNA-binding Zn-ribbon protein involved in translation (DUF1610 family)